MQILARNRAEIERSVTNVRDATDWGNKLVQKIYTNPFVLSPFYKPTTEDLRVQAVYDTAQVFTKGAQELNDADQDARGDAGPGRRRPTSSRRSLQLQQQVHGVTERLGQTSQLLAEATEAARRRGRGGGDESASWIEGARDFREFSFKSVAAFRPIN